MSKELLVVLLVLVGTALANSGHVPSAQGLPGNTQSNTNIKRIQQDPAFRAGYDDGYRLGANDAMANSTTYNDESSSVYRLATDGYSAQYGDLDKYQRLFRLGYIAGYKLGWDSNVGRYCGFCGGGGP
jgi:hypothetical protein